MCRPSGRTVGSLATGLNLSKEGYEQLIAGKCDRWYHQKEAFKANTHINAMEFMRAVNEDKSTEVAVTKNQLRAALGIVKTKSAAIQYEERIAELHAAGSDVGDFGHSRKAFPSYVICGMCLYQQENVDFSFNSSSEHRNSSARLCTADKSMNHRVTN